jgi:hypothetical protein
MIRRLLFILFLYILLVWLIAFYFYYSTDTLKMVDQGLLWTAGGVAALLLWLVAEWAIGFSRVRRAQRPASPVARTAPHSRRRRGAA